MRFLSYMLSCIYCLCFIILLIFFPIQICVTRKQFKHSSCCSLTSVSFHWTLNDFSIATSIQQKQKFPRSISYNFAVIVRSCNRMWFLVSIMMIQLVHEFDHFYFRIHISNVEFYGHSFKNCLICGAKNVIEIWEIQNVLVRPLVEEMMGSCIKFECKHIWENMQLNLSFLSCWIGDSL